MERYGLIGEKLGHSFSKEIHEDIMDYQYDLIELKKDEVGDFLEKKEFSALNVTIPYKQTVIPYLDEIDEKAEKIGAVNTIVNRDGKLIGYNTDYDGIVSLLRKNKVDPKGKNVLILGTGGTSNTAYSVFADLCAASIKKVSRSGKNGALTYEEAYEKEDPQIIFNATPSGMFPDNVSCPIDIDRFHHLEAVIDVVYNPLNTALVVKAKERGLIADGGLYMLVSQAISAIEKFKDISIDLGMLDGEYEKNLHSRRNIVLIGMPGCGKTTVMNSLNAPGEKIDLDEEIVKEEGITIPEIFSRSGEQGFRDIESRVIREFSKRSSLIISTGGGCVTRKENMDALKQNGLIVYLKRDLEKLEVGNGRPLTMNFEALRKKYDERNPLYERYADVIIDNNGMIDETVKEMEELL